MIALGRLTEILNYDPETGEFHWKVARGGFQKGSIAGSIDSKGYVTIKICGKDYKAHRLAWIFVYGEWPSKPLDHIDMNRGNNGIRNLREATQFENFQNRKAYRSSKTGVKGVCLHKSTGKFCAQIRANGKRFYIGLFETLEAADRAVRAAREKLHGEFCRHE